MSFHRVLVMQSVEDAITDKRKRRIENNPAQKDCQFAFCYAVELSYDQKMIPIPIMVSQVSQEPFDTNKLVARLVKHIQAFNPDLLVVHYGFIFQTFPYEIIAAMKTIRSKFTHLKFGLRGVHLLVRQLPEIETIFDKSVEINNLVEQMFSFERVRDTFPYLTKQICLN